MNSLSATVYEDHTFARVGFSLTDRNNTFTALAQDSLGRSDTHAISVSLPATVNYTHDANGNMTGDGNRHFLFDDENQLTTADRPRTVITW